MSQTVTATASKQPQDTLREFWDRYITKEPGKVTTIFPKSLYANLLPHSKKGTVSGSNASESYEAAVKECRERVKRIVEECRRTNQKYTDPDFDIETDEWNNYNCLRGLIRTSSGPGSPQPGHSIDLLRVSLKYLSDSGLLSDSDSVLPFNVAALSNALGDGDDDSDDDESYSPGSAHRVDWIFDKPAFCVDGFSASDVRQGGNGDCWWLAAVATLCSVPGVMDRVCVARNEKCGVYGFVFHRDGDWFPVIIDDCLYLKAKDFEQAHGEVYDSTGEMERKYKQSNQTGSDALYFAHCVDPNETWLPLLEKAYAKAHGDYAAISGGLSGEAVEDMTGGITTSLSTSKVLNKDLLWRELRNEYKEFLFAVSAPWAATNSGAVNGLAMLHAYSVLKAVEEVGENGERVRLVLVRNPWGQRSSSGIGEWQGPWSDGSKEWTPYWMEKLNHRFGDDGMFWMSYSDFLKRFAVIHRTRLFRKDWTVVQQWTSVNVSWVTGYLNTKFSIEITQPGPVVLVLSQLDDRYFKGLEGQYDFTLNFILQRKGAKPNEFLVRARGNGHEKRSVSAEVELEPGEYEIVPKILAQKFDIKPSVEDVVRLFASENPQKLKHLGINYDLAHAKAVPPTEEEIEAQEDDEDEEREEGEDEDEDGCEDEDEDEDQSGPDGQLADDTVCGSCGAKKAETEEKDNDGGNQEGQDANEEAKGEEEHDSDTWNAVCVIGLRVLSKDPDITIQLIAPENDEEGAGLDIEGSGLQR